MLPWEPVPDAWTWRRKQDVGGATVLSRGRSCPGDASGTLSYLTMLSVSLLAAILILFWASRWVMPSVLTPSMAVMMSPWARLPFTALLPGVICA